MSDQTKLQWKGGSLSLHRCQIMGILNITSDSFYDGGRYTDLESSLERAWSIVDEGGDILDIGGESSRPGSQSVSIDEEKKRIFPLLEKLHAEKYPLPISLDTTKPKVLEEAIRNGWVQIANDITGLREPAMVEVVKANQIPVIIMHMMGTPVTMQKQFSYDDVVADIKEFFKKRLAETGLKNNVVLDPGIGFGKSVKHNIQLLQRLSEFSELGFPLMIGASRKSFLGEILDLPVEDRLEGSLAAAAIAIQQGAKILRVHDVQSTVRLTKTLEAILRDGVTPSPVRKIP